MKEIDILDLGIIPTDLLGDLHIKTIILVYEYPRCFIAKNDSGNLYALLENQDGEDDFGWNVTEINIEDLKCVNRGQKNIQSLFLDKKSYLLQFKSNSDVGKVIQVNEFSGKYSIEGNMIVKNFLRHIDLY